MSDTCERSAAAHGWFPWLGTTLWFHIYPYETALMFPPLLFGLALALITINERTLP